MNYTAKPIISLALALVMCLGLLSAGAWASDEPEDTSIEQNAIEQESASSEAMEEAASAVSGSLGDVQWTLENGVFTLYGEGELHHEYLEGEAPYRDQITSVVISEGISNCGGSLFSGCTNLIRVTIPESVREIDQRAFRGCTGLTSISMPASLTKISSWAFSGCASLASVEIPASVTVIGRETFFNCTSLTSITIPRGVRELGYGAFAGCASLQSVTFEGDAPELNVMREELVPWESEGLYTSPLPSGATVYYHEDAAGWTEEAKAAMGEGLTWVALERETEPDDTDTSGEEGASGTCGENLTWSLDKNGVLTISGTGEMYDYYIDINNGLNNPIKGYAPWAELDVKVAVIQPGVTAVGSRAFTNCKSLSSVTIPNSVTEIGPAAFMQCTGLTEMMIPDSVTELAFNAFAYCTGLTEVGLPESLISLGRECFRGCVSLTGVTLPSGVTAIEDLAFYECTGLKAVALPESVTHIGVGSFCFCKALESVTFPCAVNFVGYDAFGGCMGLKSVVFEGGAPEMQLGELEGIQLTDGPFNHVTATVYYYEDTAGWTEEVMADYGGTLTWVSLGRRVLKGDKVTAQYEAGGGRGGRARPRREAGGEPCSRGNAGRPARRRGRHRPQDRG